MSARPVDTITDAKGRVIEVTTLSVLEQYRLRASIRPELRSDDVAVSLATAAASVKSIGGAPVVFPQNPEQLEAIISLLDDDGWAVLMDRIQRKVAEARAVVEASEKEGSGPLDTSAPSQVPTV